MSDLNTPDALGARLAGLADVIARATPGRRHAAFPSYVIAIGARPTHKVAQLHCDHIHNPNAEGDSKFIEAFDPTVAAALVAVAQAADSLYVRTWTPPEGGPARAVITPSSHDDLRNALTRLATALSKLGAS